MACELADGRRPLPGGRIFKTDYWLVEHCLGRLGLGTLIVKPERHVTSVANLSDDEAAELGPLLRCASAVAEQLVSAEQTYNCMWVARWRRSCAHSLRGAANHCATDGGVRGAWTGPAGCDGLSR